jgi:hypothetical protein
VCVREIPVRSLMNGSNGFSGFTNESNQSESHGDAVAVAVAEEEDEEDEGEWYTEAANWMIFSDVGSKPVVSTSITTCSGGCKSEEGKQ